MTDAPTPSPTPTQTPASTPQDAPRPAAERADSERPSGSTPSWTTWRPAAGSATTTPVATPGETAPQEATLAPHETAPVSPTQTEAMGRSEVTYLPAPSGPNWGLVVLGLLFVLVAGGVVANQLMGFQVAQLTEVGPSVLVIGGLACAAVGAVGILARRR